MEVCIEVRGCAVHDILSGSADRLGGGLIDPFVKALVTLQGNNKKNSKNKKISKKVHFFVQSEIITDGDLLSILKMTFKRTRNDVHSNDSIMFPSPNPESEFTVEITKRFCSSPLFSSPPRGCIAECHPSSSSAAGGDPAAGSSSYLATSSPRAVQIFLQRLSRERHFQSLRISLEHANLNAQVW
jgi:hypothetical protein